MICHKCNEDNPEDSLFCKNCGASLTTNTGTLNNAKNKHKKIIISTIIGICITGGGLGSYAYCKQHQETVKSSSVKATSVQADNANNKQQDNNSKQADNKINGVDLGILTKEDIKKAMDIGKNYKGKSNFVEGKNSATRTKEEFRQTYGSSFLVNTPYSMAIGICADLTQKYVDVNTDSFIKAYGEWNKKYGIDFNNIRCTAYVGGDTRDFIKDTHMVLRVYGTEEKVLQPLRQDKSLPAEVVDFDSNPKYYNSVLASFDAKEVQKLNPKQIEIVVIYPGGKEVKQKFEYNKLNDL